MKKRIKKRTAKQKGLLKSKRAHSSGKHKPLLSRSEISSVSSEIASVSSEISSEISKVIPNPRGKFSEGIHKVDTVSFAEKLSESVLAEKTNKYKGFVRILSELIIDPGKFFTEAKHEWHFSSRFYILTLFVILLAFILIVSAVLRLFSSELSDLIPSLNGFVIFAGIVFGVFAVYLLIIHAAMFFFNRKKEFRQSIKVGLYASTPILLFGWVPNLAVFAIAYSAILHSIGISKVHDVDTYKAVLIAVVATGLVLLGLVVYLSATGLM